MLGRAVRLGAWRGCVSLRPRRWLSSPALQELPVAPIAPAVTTQMKLEPGHELDIIVSDPSSFFALVLEAVHYYAGQPWWLVVPVCGFAMRAALQPLYTMQKRRSRRLLEPLAPQLRSAMGRAMKGWTEAQSARALLVVARQWLVERHAVLRTCTAGHFSRNVYIYSAIGIMIASFTGLRFALRIDPSFATQGALWFPALNAHDPWLRLVSVYCAASMLVATVTLPSHPLRRLMFVGLTLAHVAMLPLAHFVGWEEGMVLYLWGFLGFRMAHALYERTPWVRRIAARNTGTGANAADTPANPRW